MGDTIATRGCWLKGLIAGGICFGLVPLIETLVLCLDGTVLLTGSAFLDESSILTGAISVVYIDWCVPSSSVYSSS